MLALRAQIMGVRHVHALERTSNACWLCARDHVVRGGSPASFHALDTTKNSSELMPPLPLDMIPNKAISISSRVLPPKTSVSCCSIFSLLSYSTLARSVCRCSSNRLYSTCHSRVRVNKTCVMFHFTNYRY